MRSLFVVTLLLLGLSGCSKEPTEEQKEADEILAKAKIFLARGEYREARALLEEARELDEGLSRTARVAEELKLVGSAMKATAEFDSAFMYYNRAIEQYRNVADRDAVREITLEIASVVRMRGEERRAFGIYVEALRLARVFKDDEGIRDIEWAMLASCRALDERIEERRILAELLKECTARKDVGGLGRIHFETGLSQCAVGGYDSAAQSFQRAFALTESMKDSLLPLNALLWLGIAEGAAGDLRRSFQAYGDAIRRSEKVRGAQPIRLELFARVGNAYLRTRRFTDAARFYRAALTTAINTGNKLAEAYIALQLGHCDLESKRDAAVKTYQSSLELLRSLGHVPGIVYAQVSLGIAAKRSAQFTEAYKNLKAAVDAVATIAVRRDQDDLYVDCERAFLGPARLAAYDELTELLLAAGKFDEGFSLVEQRNAVAARNDLDAFEPRPLNEALAGALQLYFEERAKHIGAEQLLEQVLRSGFQQKEQLASIKTVMDNSTKKMAEASDEVVRLNRAYEPVVTVAGTGLGAVQKALVPGVAFVEFAPTRKALYAFVATAGRTAVRMAAVSADSIISQSHQFVTLLRRRELRVDSTRFQAMRVDQRLQQLTGQLFSAYIRPVESDVAGVTKIIAVFGGDLPTVPLHVLRRGTLPGAPFLCEQHLITYLPSAAALTLGTAALESVHEVIGFGHPGNTSWDVEYELRDIRAFYKEARLFFNQQAALNTLQTEKADILHLAVEVRHDGDAPRNSYVTLSDGKTMDGERQVPLGELFSMASFPSVVLSDLEVNHTTIVPSEAYIYLINGTGALITNAYTPSRKTKKIFGEMLYTALLQGNTTPAAYWKTQLEMMRNPESSGQYAWGAFFLWGK